MKRKMGRITALLTAAAMSVSMFAGTVNVYADELIDDSAALEVISEEGSYDANADQPQLTEDLTDINQPESSEDTAELDLEDLQMAQDPEAEDLLTSQDLDGSEDLMSIDEDTAIDDDKDEKSSRSSEKGTSVDADGNMNQKDVPVSYGEALRFYGDGSFMNENQHIYYGTIPSNAVNLDYYLGADYWYQDQGGGKMPYWRILDHKKDNTDTSGAILLLSEDDWGLKDPKTAYITYGDFPFDKDNSNDWNNSDSRVWCLCFYYDIFSKEEQAAIRPISKAEGSGEIYYYNTYDIYDSVWDSYKALTIQDEPVFFLSVEEVQKYLKDYYDGGKYYNNFSSFWLRTASNFVERRYDNNLGRDVDLNCGYTYSHGLGIRGIDHVPVGDVDYSAARPAFNIEGSEIIFASDAGAGKVSNGVGTNAVTAVDDECGTRDWRLTLHDSSRDKFKATCSFASNNPSHFVQPGGKLSISYSGAIEDTNEYVSVIICDKNGEDILYYGRIANNSASGTTDFTIPTTVTQGQTYTLMVFSEQYNGDLTDPKRLDKVTDLASDPTKNSFTIKVAYDINNATLQPTQWYYDGASHIPAVKQNGNVLTLNKHYSRLVTNSKGAEATPVYGGTYTMNLTGKIEAGYYGTSKKYFKIIPWNVSSYTYQSASSYNYNGAVHIPSVIFSRTKKALVVNRDYKYSIKNYSTGAAVSRPINAGTYAMTITGINGYTGTVVRYFKINKIANTLKVTRKTKTFSFTASKKTKRLPKNKTIDPKKIYKFTNKGVGKLSYSLASVKKGKENFSSFFSVKSNGKVAVRAGARKGTYTVKVNVKAAGGTNYLPKTQVVTFTIKVK